MTGQTYTIFQPETFHVVSHTVYGHGTAHNIHWSFAHKATTQNKCLCTIVNQTAGNLQAFIFFHTSFETVTHIHFDQYSGVITGSFSNFIHNLIHEAHPIVQAAAIFIFAVVSVGRKKLADQIAVSGMNLNSIESGFLG